MNLNCLNIIKKLLFFLLLTVSLIANAQPDPSHRYREEMFTIEEQVRADPNNLELHYRLFELYSYVASKQKTFDKINFLLSQKPDNVAYQKSKFITFFKYPYKKNDVEKAYQYYLDDLEPISDNCTKKKHLTRIADGYKTADIDDEALIFYEKALNISKCEKENHNILKRKQELYHELKDYENSYLILKQLDDYPSHIGYNTIYLKDYKKSIHDLFILLEKSKGVTKKDNKYYINKKEFYHKSSNKRILSKLAYNYYKTGDLEKSLSLLHILTQDSFSFDLFNNYMYWCMYLDLYEQYKNTDYRVHLLLAHRYIAGSYDLRSSAYFTEDIPQPRCDPHEGLNIPYISNEEQEIFIINLGIKEIAVAEKLTNKKFNRYRAYAFMEMKKMDEAKEILDLLIKNNPNDLKTIYCLSFYYFIKDLHIDTFEISKEDMLRKKEYDRLHKQNQKKYLELYKQSKEEPLVIDGYEVK